MNEATVKLKDGTEKKVRINGNPQSSFERSVIEIVTGGKVISPELK